MTEPYATTTLDYSFEQPVEEQNVVFRPNPGPQEDFLSAPEKQVLYGGAAGGGKSYALLADPVPGFNNPNFNGLLVRRTNDELRELKAKSHELYKKVWPKANFNKSESEWTFPSGARLWMSYLEKDEDVTRYQGQAFTWIGFDELTQWPTPYAWNYLASRLRTADPRLKTYMRATTNPGGPGHGWVKKMFIDPAPWGQSFYATDIDTGEIMMEPDHILRNGVYVPNPRAGEPLFKRRFIPSRLSDNPYLLNSGDYERMLLSMPEVQRKQLYEGNWDVAYGAAFPEWDRAVHVVPSFDIPHDWRRFRACDYGYSSAAAVIWFAVSPNDQLVIYRELYVKKTLAVDLADQVLYLEQDDGPISYGILDSSCWHKRGDVGPSIAEQMIGRGCRWRPSDRSKGSRLARKQEFHRRLSINDDGNPGLVIMNHCTNTIAQIPILPLDKSNPEDVDTDAEDHIYDAIGYGLMSRPRPMDWTSMHAKKRWTPVDSVFGY